MPPVSHHSPLYENVIFPFAFHTVFDVVSCSFTEIVFYRLWNHDRYCRACHYSCRNRSLLANFQPQPDTSCHITYTGNSLVSPSFKAADGVDTIAFILTPTQLTSHYSDDIKRPHSPNCCWLEFSWVCVTFGAVCWKALKCALCAKSSDLRIDRMRQKSLGAWFSCWFPTSACPLPQPAAAQLSIMLFSSYFYCSCRNFSCSLELNQIVRKL